MKKTTKVNPLEFFRKSAEARHKAITSGGVTEPKQKLKKAQKGIAVNDTINRSYNNVIADNQKIKDILSPNNVPRPVRLEDYDSKKADLHKAYLDSVTNNWDAKRTSPENSGTMQARSNAYQKTGGTHKMPNGKVMLNSKMQKGGTTKAAKFAALAPPYNKATAADRIAGAKKNKKK